MGDYQRRNFGGRRGFGFRGNRGKNFSAKPRTQRDAEANETPNQSAGIATGADKRGPPPVKREVPKPKALSTSFSEYNNEPPFEKSYEVSGYTGVMQLGGIATFTTTAAALGDIADVTYDQLCAMDRSFTKSVSRSMLEYYFVQLYYMRICQIELKNGSDDMQIRVQAESAVSSNWIIPSLFSEYLNCIGNFKDSTGMVAEHREIVWPDNDVFNGVRGYFGQVDEVTHVHYENRPCPGVIVQRICEDLRYTIAGGGNRMWNLPADLRPEPPEAGEPTANMLGWAPATALTTEQRDGLTACGIDVHDDQNIFPTNRIFGYNYDLMEYVDRRINELSGRLRCVIGVSTNLHGSMCQQDYARIISDGNQEPRLTDKYGKNSARIESFAKLDVRQNMFTQAMKFRYYKEGITNMKVTWSED